MARIRTIKPEFWTNEDLSTVPEATHMLAAGLLNYADDEGYFNANPKLIQAAFSPLREPSVSVPVSLQSLQSIDYIRLGLGSDGKTYGHIVKFLEYQKVSHPKASKIKDMEIAWEDSEKVHGTLTEGSSLNRIELNRTEQKGTSSEAKASGVPPTDDQRTKLFNESLEAFSRYTGKPSSNIRPLFGRWLKQTGDDCLAINRLIEDVIRDRRADPIAWVEAHFKQRSPPSGLPKGVKVNPDGTYTTVAL